MEYSPFNPIVWGAFFAFVVLTWAVVRIFLAKNPGYPGRTPDMEHISGDDASPEHLKQASDQER